MIKLDANPRKNIIQTIKVKKIDPKVPSIVLFGEIFGDIFIFPNNLPTI